MNTVSKSIWIGAAVLLASPMFMGGFSDTNSSAFAADVPHACAPAAQAISNWQVQSSSVVGLDVSPACPNTRLQVVVLDRQGSVLRTVPFSSGTAARTTITFAPVPTSQVASVALLPAT